MKRSIQSLLPVMFLVLICFPLHAADSSRFDGFSSINHLPPGEQFRQLSLMLLMSGKTGPEFVEMMAAKEQADHSQYVDGASGSDVMPDDYRTPLIRIVDQESMLRGAVQLFSFVQENLTDISTKLQSIKAANPVLISMVDTGLIMEDAIIIRNAIADSMVFLDYAQDEQMAALLGNYRVYTLFLRNQMEFAEYYEELEKITAAAVNSVGGKMDAYQRMFDDEIDQEMIQRRIESAEIMNAQTGSHFDEQAVMRTNELLMMLILMESQVR